MAYDSHIPGKPPSVIQLCRKAGMDFDCGAKSTFGQLLEWGGYFPLSKVRDRLSYSRNCLYHLSRGQGDEALASCVKAIRVKEQSRAITILVDVVRLNAILSAHVVGRAQTLATREETTGESSHPIQETR